MTNNNFKEKDHTFIRLLLQSTWHFNLIILVTSLVYKSDDVAWCPVNTITQIGINNQLLH